METFSKRYRIIPFILIFMTLLVSILYNVLKLVPEIREITEPYAPVFSLFFNLLWVIFTISLIKMMRQVWKSVHDSYQLILAQKTRDILLQQEKEVEQFQKNIVRRQEEVYETLERALMDSEAGDYDSLQQRIAQLTEHIQTNRSETFCPNSLLNTILQIKKERAQRNGIQCRFQIILPPDFENMFSDITITSLFTNLLDNAIEACQACQACQNVAENMTENTTGNTTEKITESATEAVSSNHRGDETDQKKDRNNTISQKKIAQQKFIELKTNYQANMFLIEMKNSKNPEDIFNHKTTKKENKRAHGHGLSIIEDITKQYDGICNWEDEGEIFHSTLMLKTGE